MSGRCLSGRVVGSGRVRLPAFARAGSAATTVALTRARLIDGTGGAPIEQATLVIRNGRVQAVGPAATVQIPAGAVRVDVSGKTITPGLISAHTHLAIQRRENEGPEYATRWFDDGAKLSDRDQLIAELRTYADYGVTTVYTMGEDINRGFTSPTQVLEVVKVRDEQAYAAEQGTLDRARVYMAGPNATATEKGAFGVTTPEGGRENVIRNATLYRADFIKINVNATLHPQVYGAMIDEANRRGQRTGTHIPTLAEAWGVVGAGVNALMHSVRDQDFDAALMALMKRKGVGQVPTLTQEESNFLYETTPAFFSDPFFLRKVDAFRKQMDALKESAFQEQIRNNRNAQTSKTGLQQAMRNLKLLSDVGVLIAMGTDSGGRREAGRWQGYFEQREMELMAKSGLTPMQEIVAATDGFARVMGLDGQLGTLERGKWADLLVLNANPLRDIRNLQKIDSVWIAGKRVARQPGTN